MRDENLGIPPEEELRVAPEDMEHLEDRYPSEGDERRPLLQDERRPPARRERRRPYAYQDDDPEPSIVSLLTKGEIGMGEAWLMSDMADRRERRERRYAREDETPTAAEAIKTAVSDALEKAGVTGRPSPDEMPGWADDMKSQMKNISDKLEEDTRKKETEEIIEKATKPLIDQLDRERENFKQLEARVELLGKPPQPDTQKTGMDQYIDYQAKLKAAGFLKDDKGGTIVFGEDGIPVDGSIPAWVVYAPTLADEIFDNIEKRVDRIASGFGIGKGDKDLKDLIDLPDKPKKEVKKPPLKHVEEEEAPIEELPLESSEELIKLPERARLTVSAEPEEEPKEEEAPEDVEIPEEEIPEASSLGLEMGLSAGSHEEEPVSEEPEDPTIVDPTGDFEGDVEKPDASSLGLEAGLSVESPDEEIPPEEVHEPEEKTYFCQYCAAGPFKHPLELGRHVKNCPEAKKAKGE